MITDKIKRKLALFLQDNATKANIGTGGNAPFPTAEELDVPILTTRQATTNSESDDATIDFSVTFNGSQLQGNTIREFGVFSETMPADNNFDEMRTVTPYTTDTTMVSRVTFDGIGPFLATDDIEFILTVEIE